MQPVVTGRDCLLHGAYFMAYPTATVYSPAEISAATRGHLTRECVAIKVDSVLTRLKRANEF
jgi:hypothetical protein